MPGSLQVRELADVGMTQCSLRIAELVELRGLVLWANALSEIPQALAAAIAETRA